MIAALSKSNVVPLRGKHVAMGEKNRVYTYDSLHQPENHKAPNVNSVVADMLGHEPEPISHCRSRVPVDRLYIPAAKLCLSQLSIKRHPR